ncbi:MAG: MFS transporter [Chloroflexota bacterium]
MSQTSETTSQPDYSHKWAVMAVVGVGALFETYDLGAVGVALPTLIDVFDAGFAIGQWAVLAFVLTQTSLTLAAGRLGDMLGKKRVFMSGAVIVAIGAALSGAAPSIEWLIAFRVLQAIGVAMSLALTLGILTESFPPSERGKAMGSIGAIVSIGILLGPVAGGYLLEVLSWRWIFFSQVPIAIMVFFLTWRYLPSMPTANQAEHSEQESFDYVGALCFIGMMLTLLIATTQGQQIGFGQPIVLWLMTASLLCLIGLIWVEAHTSHPILDLSLFRNQAFSINITMRLFSFVLYVGVLLLLPFYLQDIRGYTPQQAGLLLVVPSIVFGAIAPVSGTLADRIGSPYIMIVGLVCMTFGAWSVTTLTMETSTLDYVIRLLPLGLGMGIFQSPNNSTIMGNVPTNRLGMGGSLLSVVRSIGRSMGVALLGTAWVTRVSHYVGDGTGHGTDTVTITAANINTAPLNAQLAGMQDAFWVAVLGCAIALGLSLWYWWNVAFRNQS